LISGRELLVVQCAQTPQAFLKIDEKIKRGKSESEQAAGDPEDDITHTDQIGKSQFTSLD